MRHSRSRTNVSFLFVKYDLRYDELILGSFANNKQAVEFYKNSGWSRSRSLERREVPDAHKGVPELWRRRKAHGSIRIQEGEPFFSDGVHLLLGDDNLTSSEKDARHLKRVRVGVVPLTPVDRPVMQPNRRIVRTLS